MTNVTYMEPDDGSLRFYRVEVKGTKTIVTFGRLGNEGATHEHSHATAAEAAEHAENLVKKQEYKGFMKTTKRKRDADEPPRKRLRVAKAPETATVTPKKVAKKPAPKKATATKKVVAKRATTTTRAPSTRKAATGAKKATTGPKKATTGAKKATTPKKATAKKATPKKATPKKAAPKKSPISEKSSGGKPKPTNAKIPIEWEVKQATNGYGIYVNDTHVYSGDENGLVQQFDKSGVVQKQYRLPTGVKCIVGDGIFLYVGTNDGCLYDITSGVPRLMSKIEEFAQVYWMDVRNGLLAASDQMGKVALVNTEGETIWVQKENGGSGWMCLMDDTGVYHGNVDGVHKRSLTDGTKIWSNTELLSVLFGQQDSKYVYATNVEKTHKINKETGKVETTYPVGGPSIGVSKDSKLIAVANASTHISLYNIDGSLNTAFSNPTGTWANVAVSMATYGEHEFYGIRDNLIKYDFSPEGLAKVNSGVWKTQSFSAQSLAEVVPETSVETTSDTSGGILCECVKEGGKLRVRVISSGYNSSWNIQFPRAIREEGAKYVVEKIIDQGGFYRAWGDIKKVQS